MIAQVGKAWVEAPPQQIAFGRGTGDRATFAPHSRDEQSWIARLGDLRAGIGLPWSNPAQFAENIVRGTAGETVDEDPAVTLSKR